MRKAAERRIQGGKTIARVQEGENIYICCSGLDRKVFRWRNHPASLEESEVLLSENSFFFSFLGWGREGMEGSKRLFLCILSDLGKNSTHEDSTFIYLGILYFICEQSTGVER